MLAIELNTNIIPHLRLEDSVSKALHLMTDFKVSHLPVVSEEKFLGLISEDDLLDAENKKLTLQVFKEELIKSSVKENAHFFRAVTFSNEFQTNVVPVTNEEGGLVGTITGPVLLKALGSFAGAQEIGGMIVLEMESNQFSISEISRIVESNEATITHLNTLIHPDTGLLNVTININKLELATIIASFERYEYNVIYYFGEQKFESDIHSNYRHLMNYLDI